MRKDKVLPLMHVLQIGHTQLLSYSARPGMQLFIRLINLDTLVTTRYWYLVVGYSGCSLVLQTALWLEPPPLRYAPLGAGK